MTATSFEDPYLQSILEKIALEEGFKQPTYSISLGSKPGDNYVGRIFRTVITEESNRENAKSVSLIFKAAPASKLRQKKMSTEQAFRTESALYQTVLPTFNTLLNKFGVIKSSTFPGTARCLAVRLNGLHGDNCDVIVLEDKATEGFRMFRDCKSLDVEHCQQILKKLALLHAASLALSQHEPETAERLNAAVTGDSFYVNDCHPMLGEMKKSALDTLRTLREPCKKGSVLYDKAESLVLNYNIEMATANRSPSDLSCIIHGDCWFNNVLFKYTKHGSVDDVCLLDLQLVRVASPAVELSYVIFICTTKEVRDTHYDELIRFYHNEVTSHLRKMALNPDDIIPWDRLQEHLRKYSKVGILMAISTLPIVCADSSEIIIDSNSCEEDGDVFAGCAKVTDPKKLEEISQRVTDVIVDAVRWNYL